MVKRLFSLLLLASHLQCVPISFSVTPASESPFKVIIFDLGEVIFGMPKVWSLPDAEKEPLLAEHPELEGALNSNTLHKDMWQLLPAISATMTPIDPEMLRILPCFMANWLTGMSSEEGLKAVHDYLTTSEHSEAKRKMIKAMARQFLDPRQFVALLHVIESTTELAKLFKEQGYQLYILSNWDRSSFPVLKERHPEFFNLFDGVVISGHEGTGKPNEKIYRILLERYGLKPEECVFIDDVHHNVKAAQDLGIYGLHMDSEESVFSQLEKLGLISVPR